MSRNVMLCYYTPSFCDMLCTALERTHLFRNFIRSQTSVKPFIRTCPPTPSHHQRRISSGSYFLAFTIRVSHTQTPSQFCLRQHNRKQLLLVRLHFCVGYLSMVWTYFSSGQSIKISLKSWVTIPVKLTCSLCTKGLGRNVGQKLIMWSGKWGLYQDISQRLPQICLHMFAQDMYHVIG